MGQETTKADRTGFGHLGKCRRHNLIRCSDLWVGIWKQVSPRRSGSLSIKGSPFHCTPQQPPNAQCFQKVVFPKLVSMWPHMMVRKDHAAVCLLPPQSTPTNIPSDTTRDEILGVTLLKVRGSSQLPSSTTIYLAHQGSREFLLLCLEMLVLRHGLSLELHRFIHMDPRLTKLQVCSTEKRAKSASRENSYTIPLPTKF